MSGDSSAPSASKSGRRVAGRLNIFIRRVHLYAGLFLLPWVLLYGITGAMFNHLWLFPESSFVDVPAEQLADSSLAVFPAPSDLAECVVAAMKEAAPGHTIALDSNHRAAFNNDVILEVTADNRKHAVHIDPVVRSARVVEIPDAASMEALLPGVKNIELPENPYSTAQQAVPAIMTSAGIESASAPRPRGWCKLNFLAQVDGSPALVTYVLRDGHVDVTPYRPGDPGFSARQFFMRLHTSHGQPPHWNARMVWSLLLDTMAFAMVTWALTGIFMWWQIRRTRIIGSLVVGLSVLCSALLFFGMVDFYATTRL
ncbi:MAG: PepSY domain-containing protein [Planctomycetaceae bacterium]